RITPQHHPSPSKRDLDKIATDDATLTPLTDPNADIRLSIDTLNETNSHLVKSQENPSSPSLLQRGMNLATKTWTEWGKAEGGWKLKVHHWGERMYERVDFEEIALKSIDPALGPRLTTSKASGNPAKETRKAIKAGEKVSIPLYHPPSVLPDPLGHMMRLLEHRVPSHRKWFWIWLLGSPFTAPFMIIPVIPNIPFFFCVWRAWSHWKGEVCTNYLITKAEHLGEPAYKAATFLQQLVHQKCIIPTPHTPLDQFYQSKLLSPPTPSPSAITEAETKEPLEPEGAPPPEHTPLLLTREQIPSLLETLDAEDTPGPGEGKGAGLSGLGPELARAVDQAGLRVAERKAKQ
ncbi:hypothetical protein FRB99_002607, partial [Tulasnella sp. 403]